LTFRVRVRDWTLQIADLQNSRMESEEPAIAVSPIFKTQPNPRLHRPDPTRPNPSSVRTVNTPITYTCNATRRRLHHRSVYRLLLCNSFCCTIPVSKTYNGRKMRALRRLNPTQPHSWIDPNPRPCLCDNWERPRSAGWHWTWSG